MRAVIFGTSPSDASEAEKHDLPRGEGCGVALASSRRFRNGSKEDVDEIEDDLDLNENPVLSENTDSGDDDEDPVDCADDDQGGETSTSLGMVDILE